MSDKWWHQLWEIDRILRKLFPTQMWPNDTTICNIRMFGGFEIFNTRPYHNYENWAEGYEMSTPLLGGVKVTAEDLDTAVYRFAEAINEKLVADGKQPINVDHTQFRYDILPKILSKDELAKEIE